MPTDAELLRHYVQEGAEEAFTELVRRNVGLVYAAALRRTGGQSHLAEEVAQKVFSDLSLKAVALSRHPCLVAWLYRSTRYAAIDALRAGLRRTNLAQSFSTMHDDSSAPEIRADWEQLRPVLDEAMDELKDRDRELMLLRFFGGLSFAEVGTKLGLSENAARKRTERALERLRVVLGQRGISSPAAALSLLLSHEVLASAPASVATSVATAALATPPATGLASFLTALCLSKVTAPVLGALIATGVTTVFWASTHSDLQPAIAALRQEHARLKAATATSTSSAAISREYEQHAEAIAQAMAPAQANQSRRSSRSDHTTATDESARSPHGYDNRGQATARAAVETFAWACDVGDSEVLAKLVYLDDQTRARAQSVLLRMPAGIRAQCRTPEELYGLLLAASSLEAPPPDALIVRYLMNLAELEPGRVATRRIGSSANFHEFLQTSEGWKYVLPVEAIDSLPQVLNRETLANLSRRP